MVKAILIVSQKGQPTREVESGERETSIGSALNNIVPLEPEPGVDYYHAVIERRGDEHWLSDCGTRQGTKLNGEPVEAERKLEDGDLITLGGSCHIEFYRHDPATQPPEAANAHASSAASGSGSELGYYAASAGGSAAYAASARATHHAAADTTARHQVEPDSTHVDEASTVSKSPSSSKVIVASVLGAVVITGAAALIFNPFGGGGCRPSARIMTPLNGTTLRSASTLRVEVSEKQCVKRISYQLDGEEVAAAADPYEATLDPRRLTRFAPGRHVLTATVETTDGAQIQQPGEVSVALEAPAEKRGGAATPTPAEEVTPASEAASPVAAADVQAMAERLASQISGQSGYVFEREMTARIRARTAEFESADPAAPAAPYRTVILKAFGSDRNVKPLLGFVLAMSRSKFDSASGEGGIWRTPPAIAREYPQAGQSPDTPQREAEVAAFYLKELLDVFESGNFDLAVACYGCTLPEADAMRQRLAALPASERRSFWHLVERGVVTPEQAERVVRFYAAGVVGENPKRFGAASDRTLSSLCEY
jgi:hypothetical protein